VISEVVKKVVSTERVSMEDNTTRSEELDINSVTYPLYRIYLKMFLMLVAAILMLISSVMVILAILKGKKLRSVNNLLIVNLLFTDLAFCICLCRLHNVSCSCILFYLETNDFCPSGIDVVKGNYTDGYSTGCLSHR